MNTKSVKLTVGQKFTLKVKKITPAKASKKVTYATSKKAVATVTNKGVITAKSAGNATITVTAKSNKKAKAKVKVVVSPAEVAPTAAPTAATTLAPTAPVVAPTATATAAATAKPTKTPTRTPRPATPVPTDTPAPTAPSDMLDHPSAPYTLQFNENTVQIQEDATADIATDGKSVTIGVNAQYSGVAFVVPSTVKENNFDTVTVTYKSPVNTTGGFGCGLWRTADGDGAKDTEDVIAWGSCLETVEGNGTGTYTASIKHGVGETNAWYITKALFFFNNEDTLANGPAKVTITSVVFSHSQYKK